ncbi:MNIO family bufferin maturase [Duganella alba]|nr:DUF692 domain-containing protein [Duganella alba]
MDGMGFKHSGPRGGAAIPAQAGIGLRHVHHEDVAAQRPAVAWLEVHTENFMGGGAAIALLEQLRRDYPLSLHGVGLSLGSATGLDHAHLRRLAQVAARVAPGLVSEHLSWSAAPGVFLPELLPLPLTEEALAVVCANVQLAQDVLARPLLLENPSTCLQYHHSTIPEWEFMAAVAARTGCGILCDVNNIYVSAQNHGWDARGYLDALPAAAVGEIHLAGHSVRDAGGQQLHVDDHGSAPPPAVWELYRYALQRFGRVPTLIEWDNDVPPLAVLLAQARIAGRMLEAADAPR